LRVPRGADDGHGPGMKKGLPGFFFSRRHSESLSRVLKF
jgi:hypothetical protein